MFFEHQVEICAMLCLYKLLKPFPRSFDCGNLFGDRQVGRLEPFCHLKPGQRFKTTVPRPRAYLVSTLPQQLCGGLARDGLTVHDQNPQLGGLRKPQSLCSRMALWAVSLHTAILVPAGPAWAGDLCRDVDCALRSAVSQDCM